MGGKVEGKQAGGRCPARERLRPKNAAIWSAPAAPGAFGTEQGWLA